LTDIDGIVIRAATVDDAAAVHEMVLNMAEDMNVADRVSSTVSDFDQAMSGDHPAIHVFIAEKNTRAVGMIIFFLSFSTWRGAPGVYISDVYLTQDFRGTGLGKKLVGDVVCWGAKRGADHMRLAVDPKNDIAQSFYKGIGMSFCSDEMIFQISGTDFRKLGTDT
jgi:GNAT superfamily N-acetyltransferase